MSSEIRANTLKNRVGLGTVSYTNTGIVVSGIVTANSFSGPYNGTDIVGTGITLTSTDAGSSAGPELKLFRNSASPADADYLGQLKFAGESDTGVERNYAKITGKILDASNGTEDGILEFAHIKGGSQTITGRWRSDSLQLLNGTSLTVAGNTTLTGDIDVDGHTNLDNLNIAGVTTVSDNINVVDSKHVYWGTDNDLSITHNGTHGYIHSISGGLYMKVGNGEFLSRNGNEVIAKFLENGAVELYYNNVKKLATTANGIKLNDDTRIGIGDGEDLRLFHDSSATNNVISGHTGSLNLRNQDTNSTDINLSARNDILLQTAINESAIWCDANAGVHLYHDSSQKFVTTSSGVSISGSVEIDRGSASDVALTVNTTSTTNACRIAFNESGTRKGEVAYSHDNDQIELIGKSGNAAAIFTDNSTRLAITSGGHVNIGGNYTSTTYGFSVRGGAVDQSTRFSNTKSSNGDIHYIGISLTNNGFGQALFGHTGHTTAGSQAAWMGLSGDDVAGGVGVKCYRGGTVQMGASSTLQAFINNSVSGHQFISQCSDNNNGFEIYQKHGSTATRKTLAVYANTGNSAAKQIQFEVRGNNTTHAYGTKNTSPFTLSTAIGPSGAHSYGDENRLDFLMYNEIPQFTGNPAARIAGYLQRGNNGFGLRFYARTNASTLFKAMEITADYEVLPGINGSVDLGSSSYRWKNVYTSDLDLSNEAKGGNDVDGTWGSYTIQEGESDLFLINKRNGKKYKFNLTEVS